MDTIGLIRLSQEGNVQAREQLVTENVGLVWSMVRRFLGRGCEAEDLFQIGTIGLIKAIDKFGLTKYHRPSFLKKHFEKKDKQLSLI